MNANKYILLLALLTMMACKKETVESAYPYTSILSFTVPVADASTGSIEAAVYDQTLTLYWPDYLERPDSIAPEIIVSGRASVQPASGTQVALKDGLRYTVTAQNGQTATYILKLVINQKEPQFSATTVSIPLYNRYAANGLVYDLFPDQERTQLFAISAAGTEYRLPIVSVSRTGIVFFADAYTGAAPDTGWHRLKVINADRTATSTDPLVYFSAADPAPYIFQERTDTLVLQPGATFTLPVRYLNGYTVSRVRLGDPDLEIVSTTANTVTLRVPDGMSPGLYNSFRLYAVNSSSGRSTNRFAYLGAFNTVKVTE